MRSLVGYIFVAFLIAACVAAYCQFIVEPDNFYHLAHARHYWEKGIFNTDFPYAAYSVVAAKQSDLWWGFHVLLSPLTLIPDKTLILAVAPGVLMFIYMMIGRGVMTTLKLNPWYGLALLPASGSLVQRMDTVRPQTLSAPLLVLVAAGFAANSTVVSLLAAAAIGFLHPTLSYMVVLVSLASLFAKKVVRSKGKLWAELLAPLIAMAIGCLRPNPLAGLELLKIQLYDLFMVKKAGEVTNFGAELAPGNYAYFLSGMLGPLIVLTLCCLLAVRGNKSKTAAHAPSALLTSLVLSMVAVGLMFFVTKRGIDQFAPFTLLLAVLIASRTGGLNWMVGIVFLGNGLWSFGQWGETHWKRVKKTNAQDYKRAIEYISQHSKPGDIVGHAVWSDFGPLMYWGPEYVYLGGMDPVFQYRFNPETYWLMTINAAGRDLGQTSRFNPLKEPGKEEPISVAWPRDLKTKWLICAAKFNETFQEEFRKDPNVKLVYQDEGAHVYELPSAGLDVVNRKPSR